MDDWIVEIETQRRSIKEQGINNNIQRSASSLDEGLHFPGIYRVPLHILQQQEDPSVFTPLKTSFGPYHHGTPSCQPRQRHKELCLPHFLNRTKNTLENIIEQLKQMAAELRMMYDHLNSDWQKNDNEDAFLRMMVLDGCYLLQIMLEDAECRCNCNINDDCRCRGIIRKSALFDPKEMATYRRDMLLVENQIPLRVLMVLYPEQGRNTYRWLRQLIHGFFSLQQDSSVFEPTPCLHLLEVYRDGLLHNHGFSSLMGKHCLEVICGKLLCNQFCGHLICRELCCKLLCDKIFCDHIYDRIICGKICDEIICGKFCGGIFCRIICGARRASSATNRFRKFINNKSSKSRPFKLLSATKLEEADIQIRASGAEVLRIWFEHSTLMVPQIDVKDTSISIYHNLVLFERFSISASFEFSSYVIFMNGLLEGVADSRLLQSKGIIYMTDPITEDDHVGKLFLGLSKNIAPSLDKVMSPKFRNVMDALEKRYKKNTSPWRRDLFQNYLRSPWAVISIIAALLIFILTAVQTFYSVFAYYNPR